MLFLQSNVIYSSIIAQDNWLYATEFAPNVCEKLKLSHFIKIHVWSHYCQHRTMRIRIFKLQFSRKTIKLPHCVGEPERWTSNEQEGDSRRNTRRTPRTGCSKLWAGPESTGEFSPRFPFGEKRKGRRLEENVRCWDMGNGGYEPGIHRSKFPSTLYGFKDR